MKRHRSLFTLMFLGFTATNTFAADAGLAEFHPGELWPDDKGVPINAHGGGIVLHEGVYYWFGEHKIEGDAGNVAHVGVHVCSSRDLLHWQDGGIALAVSDDPKSEIVKGCIIERPKVIYNAKTKTFVGTESENAITFESQSTFVLPVPGRPGEFTYMGDRWRPKNAIDGRYVWLPVEWENDRPVLRWHAEWDLSFFARP